MDLPLKWEFLWGEIYTGEAPDECHRREIPEEIGLRISLGEMLTSSIHHFPFPAVVLTPLLAMSNPSECFEPFRIEHVTIVSPQFGQFHSPDWAVQSLDDDVMFGGRRSHYLAKIAKGDA